MFGYLQPYKPYMLVKDYELYKSVYCGLCKQLGKEYGILARMTLSYDCTCYTLLAMGLTGKNECVNKKRCTCNPLKSCLYCTDGSEQLSLASAITVVTVYYKLVDDIKDSSFIGSIPSRLLKPIANIWRKKSLKKYPEIDQILSELNDNQFEAEHSNTPDIDQCAEPTALMMKQLMQLLAHSDAENEIFGEFGYYLGKWVYLIDAGDDYDKDLKKNNFNPFIYQLKEKNLTQQQRSEYINGVLNVVASRLLSAYNLMEIKTFNAITDNLVNMGLGQMQNKILFHKYEEKNEKKVRKAKNKNINTKKED